MNHSAHPAQFNSFEKKKKKQFCPYYSGSYLDNLAYLEVQYNIAPQGQFLLPKGH